MIKLDLRLRHFIHYHIFLPNMLGKSHRRLGKKAAKKSAPKKAAKKSVPKKSAKRASKSKSVSEAMPKGPLQRKLQKIKNKSHLAAGRKAKTSNRLIELKGKTPTGEEKTFVFEALSRKEVMQSRNNAYTFFSID